MNRRIHLWCFLIVIGLAPLPLGSNRPLPWSVLGLMVGLLCLTLPWVIEPSRRGRLPGPAVLAAPAAGFGAAVLWAALQSLPLASWLPPGWGAGGGDGGLWARTAAVLARVGAPPPSPTLSLDAQATRVGILRLLTYGGVFWLAAQHTSLSRRPHRLVDVLAVVGMAYAGYGLAEYVSGRETILGMPKWAYIGDLTSTFVNRNNYATFAGMGLLTCVTALAHRLRGIGGGLAPLLLHLRRRTALYALGAGGMALALFNTGSRAGIVASLLGLASLLLFLAVQGGYGEGDVGPGGRPRRRGAWAVAIWLLLIGALAAWLLLSTTFAVDGFDRALVYRLTAQGIARHPWTGTGLGTFAAAFEALRPPALVLPWREAHDTYLELAFELGVPAALALLGAVAWPLGTCLRALRHPTAQGEICALAAAATVLVAVHSLVDFSAQIPAVTVYWLALLGAGAARAAPPPARTPPAPAQGTPSRRPPTGKAAGHVTS